MADRPAARSRVPPAPRRTRSPQLLLLISLVFHLAFLPSIFDIYFKSPVVEVQERFSVDAEAGTLAKRVVLFVGDGLRADKLFQTYTTPPFAASDPLPAPIPNDPPALADDVEDATTPAPFLRSLIQSGQAQWGVSHTRVPTESRPGHVALIGGMYEDVSAVTRGWTTNPVPFDSVFNQSSSAFTFGSPDILPMFKLGASDPDRVLAVSYDEEAEDFTADAVHLDLWVLDQLRVLLRNASSNPALHARLHAPGVVFFEHLLGLDTTGHSYRPHGPEYHRNIRVVDYVVRETVKLLSEFYGDDGQTAFVFTADHGMSSLGNHGDGHPDNTRTPLVVWGKGVRAQADWEESALHDEYSKDWALRGVRRDVEQADVAALMSVLAGIPLPANSAGRVPLDYLDASPELRARAAFANAKQLLSEAEAKSELKKRHAISFRPFPKLVESPADGFFAPEHHHQLIEDLLRDGSYELAEKKSLELADLALEASNYFQKYDWMLLRGLVTVGYLGFMGFTAQSILAGNTASASPSSRFTIASGLPIGAFLSLCARFAIERAPPSYYLYALFPSAFWLAVLRDPVSFLALSRTTRTRAADVPRLAGSAAAVFLSLLAIAYGYTDRRVFALVALGMGLVWPAAMLDPAWRARNGGVLMQWTASVSALGMFALLPTEKAENLRVVGVGAALLAGMMIVALRFLQSKNSPTWLRTRRFLLAEVALTAACLVITCSSALSLQRKQGLPPLNQYAGWVILSLASTLPLLHGRPRGQPFPERLAVLVFAFAPASVILSLSYEAAFYGAYIAALVAWLRIESSLAAEERSEDGRIRLAHVRVSLFFLAFLHLGFFGCGNVASISSFYLEPVYRLMTVFAPFPMGALLLFKLLIPFVALAAVSSVINRRLHLPPLSLFVVGSLLSELLTICFFFRVTDTGSWLEIGSSITNFVICSLLGLFSSALLAGGEYLMAGTAA
ncbi:Glycosyl phosphatidyl inositol anchor synthesis [Rhodotorula kratochvilovae]